MLARKARLEKLAKLVLTAVLAVGIMLLGTGMESRAEGTTTYTINFHYNGQTTSIDHDYDVNGTELSGITFSSNDAVVGWFYSNDTYNYVFRSGQILHLREIFDLIVNPNLYVVYAPYISMSVDGGSSSNLAIQISSGSPYPSVCASYAISTEGKDDYSLVSWSMKDNNDSTATGTNSSFTFYYEFDEDSKQYKLSTDTDYGITSGTTSLELTTYWKRSDTKQLIKVVNETGNALTIGGESIGTGRSKLLLLDSSSYPETTENGYAFFSNGEAVSIDQLITDSSTTQYTEYDGINNVQYNTVELTSSNTCQYGTFSYNENKPGENSLTSSSLIPLSSASSALSLPTPTASGYVFKGWATSADATTAEYSADAQVTLNDLKTGDSYSTLYGVWKKLYSFSYEGGSTTESVAEGDSVTAPAAPTLKGFTFAGWEYDSTLYQPEVTFTMPSKDVSLTATWKIAYTNISEAGSYYLVNGYSYTLDTALTVKKDSCNYASGISFYVNEDSEYVFN